MTNPTILDTSSAFRAGYKNFRNTLYNDERGRQGPAGTIKFLGGRFLTPDELCRLSARRAAGLLWVDSKVPSWVNVGVSANLGTRTEMIVEFCRSLVVADENQLVPDFGWPKGNALVPFRIRGPRLPVGWRSVEMDGRFPLIPYADSPGNSP